MPRKISFSLTTPQFLAGTKDVTRRLGWEKAKPGDLMDAVEKAMGLKKGERMVILGRIRLIDVRFEPLGQMIADRVYGKREVVREGFPNMSPDEFVAFFCQSHTGCWPARVITRLEFEKLT